MLKIDVEIAKWTGKGHFLSKKSSENGRMKGKGHFSAPFGEFKGMSKMKLSEMEEKIIIMKASGRWKWN